LNRSFISALISLACIASFPAIAQTAGSGEVQVTLSLAANPTASGVRLTGTVQPVLQDGAMPRPHPTGTMTFFDGTTALPPIGQPLTAGAASNAATFAQVFGAPDPAMVNFPAPGPSELSGDFNGDGSPDLVLYGTNINLSNPTVTSGTMQLQVFVSIPGDKFVVLPMQSFSLPPASGLVPSTGVLAILDVDGDGHLDLLDGNLVFHGKGDGTFANPSILPILATGFIQNVFVESYAADVSGDGKLDIVAVNAPPSPGGTGTIQFAFTVFRNDGGGTFTSLGSFPLAAPFDGGAYLCCSAFNIFGLSFADLNGDGKMDVLSQSNYVAEVNSASGNNLNVMLNNGDGTFGPVKAVDTSSTLSLGYDATAFADLNRDGKQDLVLGYYRLSGGNYVATALGNGDGTFGAVQELLLGDQPASGVPPYVELLDFNLDGKIDAALGSGELALGSGDGTFSLSSTPVFPQPSYVFGTAQPISYPLIQATLFPNSLPSLIYLNLPNNQGGNDSGGNAVFTPADSSSATMTAVLNAGSHSITAHYSGDSNYAATVSPAVTIDVAPAATTTTVASSANPSYAGESVTFTAAIAGLAPGAGGMVTFSNGSTAMGTAAVSNGSASFATTLPSPGNQIITAAYGGDNNDAASSGTVNQAVEAPVTVGGGSGGSTSLTVTSGQSVTTKVSVAGATGFSGTVNFSCTGLPMNASCSFSPASVTVSGTTAASSTMTISTAATAMASARDGETSRVLTVLACGLPLLGLLTLLPVARGRRLLLCLGFALFASVTSLTGCGGGSSGGTKTTPGNYAFNVVATSGAATSTASYKLTVQ
jgi:Bacterial Ig-like domain (group 3)/FG-GAP-like repeat